MYGHMANWRGCPCFPKPPKGTALNNRNSYTNVYNSIIRPNVSYAQAANPNKISTNFNSQNKQPMAPKGPVNSAQIEANRNPSANNRSIPNFNNNLINPNQYGFTNKLSTLHPLLRLTESISEGFKKEEHGSGLSGYPESLRPCLDFRTHFQTNYLRYSFSPHSPHPLVSH
ncbi:hypothetical protein TNCV_110281 [Trichonephila clavipes]|nr:hypothetical protein TNCV_110281 [Trichonephila clavipes]